MTEQTLSTTDERASGDRRESHDGPDGSTGAKRTRRRIVAPAIMLGGVAAAAIVFALGSRDAGPSLAVSGLIQGNVLVRRPDESDWEQLRSISAPIIAGTGLRTTQAGRLALTLTGSASLRLDAGSELTIDAARNFDLARGTTYIDVGSTVVGDPYTLVTPHATISDIASQVEVAVTSDSLRLRVRDGDARIVTTTGAEATASTGEQLRIDGDGDIVRDYVMPHDTEWAWVETLAGTPIVDGRPLTQFLAWVARETGRPIRYDSPLTETSVATAMLRGTAENVTPMEALDVMLSTTNFDYSLRWDGSIVIAPRP